MLRFALRDAVVQRIIGVNHTSELVELNTDRIENRLDSTGLFDENDKPPTEEFLKLSRSISELSEDAPRCKRARFLSMNRTDSDTSEEGV
jgi:hypothetical protein